MILTVANIGTPDAALLAALGYGIVFLGLSLLMAVVFFIGKIFTRHAAEKKVTPAVTVTDIPEEKPAAPGAAGQLKLYDVDPKTAAMLMAIVADKMGKPLNELRFHSIKEVK